MEPADGSAIRNDHWTIIDGLGFGPTGDQLAKLIMLADPPFAIGVSGKWGSGKTSLMRYAMARLGGEPISSQRPGAKSPVPEIAGELRTEWTNQKHRANDFLKELVQAPGGTGGGSTGTHSRVPSVRSVWYSPWQYQGDPNPLIPLLHEIREQMSVWLRMQSKASKLLRTAIESGISLLADLADSARGLGGALGKAVDRIRQTGERIERERFEVPTDAQRFHLQFERAIDLLLGGSTEGTKGRLVIFVDDLDRCVDEQVLQVLQMIKLYLSTRRCVFVLGIDRDAVEKAVERVWDGKSCREACEYIEKLFQAMVYVPVSQDYQRFIDEQLAGSGFPRDQSVVELLADILEPNPRKVKNFLNSLIVTWEVTDGREDLDACQFALVHYLRVYHPRIHLLAASRDGLAALRGALGDGAPSDNVSAFMVRYFGYLRRPPDDDGSEESKERKRTAVEDLGHRIDNYAGETSFAVRFPKHFEKEPDDGLIPRLFGRVTPQTGAAA